MAAAVAAKVAVLLVCCLGNLAAAGHRKLSQADDIATQVRKLKLIQQGDPEGLKEREAYVFSDYHTIACARTRSLWALKTPDDVAAALKGNAENNQAFQDAGVVETSKAIVDDALAIYRKIGAPSEESCDSWSQALEGR